jgi:hypothetical protein
MEGVLWGGLALNPSALARWGSSRFSASPSVADAVTEANFNVTVM